MISNLELHPAPLLDALKSRINYLNYNPNDEQIAALMRDVASHGWPSDDPQVSAAECLEVATFLIQECQRRGCRLDMRLLVDKAFPDYLQHRDGNTESHWKDLVIATLEEQLVALTHSAPAPASRAEQKAEECRIAQEILAAHSTPKEQVMAWRDHTGKSERAFYRRCRELKS